MRPLEILLLAVLLVGSWLMLSGQARQPLRAGVALRVVAAAALCFLLLQTWIEGAHWQLGPLYIALLFLLLVALRPNRPLLTIAGGVSTILLCALTAAFSYALPMFRLPKPTGPYAVGTQIMHVTRDPDTVDAAATLVNGRRELVVQLWYPASYSRKRVASYRRWSETTPLSSYQSVLGTHSRWNAPVAAPRTPFHLLLFHPAWNGRRTQDTALAEDLASQGYVVAAIDHPGNSDPVQLSNGTVVRPAANARDPFAPGSSEQIRQLIELEIRRQTRDSIAVLDALQSLGANSSSPWYGLLDVEHSGVFGHSLGGGVAVNLYLSDSRVLAAANLDGWSFGDVAGPTSAYTAAQPSKPPQSLMFLYETSYPASDPARLAAHDPEAVLDQADYQDVSRALAFYGGFRIYVPGASHWDFTDKNLYSPLKRFSEAGTISAQRAQAILRVTIDDFFDTALRGEEPALVSDIREHFPELRVEAIAGAARSEADSQAPAGGGQAAPAALPAGKEEREAGKP